MLNKVQDNKSFRETVPQIENNHEKYAMNSMYLSYYLLFKQTEPY